jgi:hypothetical protein
VTKKGWDLFPFTVALHDWGTRWIPSPHGPGIKLLHVPCDRRLRGNVICSACGETIEPRDVQIRGPTRPSPAQRRGGQGKKPLVR